MTYLLNTVGPAADGATGDREEELETCASGGGFPDPAPNRPSSLDTFDRKSLLKLWETDKLKFAGRSHEELEFYADNGSWPEQRGRLHYSMQDGELFVEWRTELEDEGSRGKMDRDTEGPS